MAATFLKTTCKIGIAIGAVVVTTGQGIWSSDAATGGKALQNVRSKIYSSEAKIMLPTVEGTSNKCREMWNNGVKTTCSFLLSAPERSRNFIKDKLK